MRKTFTRAFIALTLSAAPVLLHATPNFTSESGIRITSGTPQEVNLSTGGDYRLYFIRDFQVRSATSTDQVTWGEEDGLRLSSATTPVLDYGNITGLAILPYTDGFRMIFSAQPSTGTYKLYSATSTDGLNWFNEDEKTVNSASTTFVGSPKLVKLINGNWRLYYVQNSSSAADSAHNGIFTSVSTDEGFTWSTGTSLLSGPVGEVAASTLTSSGVRLIYTAALSGSTTNSVMPSRRANDASLVNFSAESDFRFSTIAEEGVLSFPVLTRSTESFKWRMFYSFTVAGSTIPQIYSAITKTPDPRSISPSSVYFTDPGVSFTIGGEIFSSTPTVSLSLAGQSDIIGSAITATSDRSITVFFDTQNQEIGDWTVVVTNDDGESGSLAGGLNITFPPGRVTLFNNVLRPRLGTPTQITIEIFSDGRVRADMYTLEGKLVNSFLDQDQVAGTTIINWNGQTGDGNSVASGTYLLRVQGPKLEVLKKIVVIK